MSTRVHGSWHRGNLLLALVSVVIWWMIPIALRCFPTGGEANGRFVLFALGVVAVLGTAGCCQRWRYEPWCVILWLPPMLFCASVSVYAVSGAIQELKSASSPYNLAPLAGAVALLIAIASLIWPAATLLLAYAHPKAFRVLPTLIALINTGAVGFTAIEVDYNANRQDLTVYLHDLANRPVCGATLSYERFGYGPGGKHVSAGRGAPLTSDAGGVLRPHMRKGRNEIRAVITHPKYRTVYVGIGMQYDERDDCRACTVGTDAARPVTAGSISTKEPLTMYVYLPGLRDQDSHAPKQLQASALLGGPGDASVDLDIARGLFSDSAEGDLRLNLFFEREGAYQRPRVRISGLNGTGVQLWNRPSFSEPIKLPERIFMIAPEHGYESQVTVDPTHQPGPMLFVHSPQKGSFARLSVAVYRYNKTKASRCRVELVLGPNGSRELALDGIGKH